jgi:hypothetical protein
LYSASIRQVRVSVLAIACRIQPITETSDTVAARSFVAPPRARITHTDLCAAFGSACTLRATQELDLAGACACSEEAELGTAAKPSARATASATAPTTTALTTIAEHTQLS